MISEIYSKAISEIFDWKGRMEGRMVGKMQPYVREIWYERAGFCFIIPQDPSMVLYGRDAR